MITEVQLSTLIFIAAVFWATLLAVKGTPLSKSLFDPFSNVIGVLVLILTFFDKWAWHWKIFYPWLVSTPYLGGTWKGKIKSTWVNPDTQKNGTKIEAYLVIRQKFSKIHASLLTKESSSELLSGELINKSDETWQFVGVYESTPKMMIRDRSPIHYGAIILLVKNKTPKGLVGQYWTDRNTKGEMVFLEYCKEKYLDFQAASSAYYLKRY